MSDAAVLSAICQMEEWIDDAAWNPDPDGLAQWNAEFQQALAQAERGPGWAELIARAHAVGARLEARIPPFEKLRDALKAELDAQERGSRALRGYEANLRTT
ncbi:hypothetical protein GETHLI_16810 [Geothrix limicola]|uniref:Uncharacterized protein n=1 Tax=Geothrix limicola TaxID=2927978 RepID=A0ABQ5QEB3_9BACT|nr:hypothetical protein [Geothrix limicola]GLH73179.1 hypothetical protein GETHLI_16810 [Geothrix limicola]